MLEGLTRVQRLCNGFLFGAPLIYLEASLEGGEVVALFQLVFAFASPFRKAASPAPDTSTHFGAGEASAS
jgi:hypothetical protein